MSGVRLRSCAASPSERDKARDGNAGEQRASAVDEVICGSSHKRVLGEGRHRTHDQHRDDDVRRCAEARSAVPHARRSLCEQHGQTANAFVGDPAAAPPRRSPSHVGRCASALATVRGFHRVEDGLDDTGAAEIPASSRQEPIATSVVFPMRVPLHDDLRAELRSPQRLRSGAMRRHLATAITWEADQRPSASAAAENASRSSDHRLHG